jgi:hypothetical protein
MNLSDKVIIPTEVMARQVGDETVILDLRSGTYFSLDPVGARIWQHLSDGRVLSDLCDLMLEEYEVARDQFDLDLSKLLDELGDKGLITFEPASSP